MIVGLGSSLALAGACGEEEGRPIGTGPGTGDTGDGDGDGDPTGDGDGDPTGDGDGDTTGDGDGDAFVHDNPYGIGLVIPGDAFQLDLAANLAGQRGGVRLTFAGITKDMHDAPGDWKTAVQLSYERDLVPYVRLGPPWGDRKVRNQSDDPAHLDYGGYAQAYADTVASLPMREGWPLYIEVHNEPNLCYEWTCDPGDGNDGWLPYEVAAAEYANMLSDVADALHGLGDPRVKVINGGLAPGGAVNCECNGDGCNAGITSVEFIQAMAAGSPGVFAKLDAWASHSYPAEGKGWGFFVSYEDPSWQAETGLRYYEDELAAIAMQLPVVMTETGWTTDLGASFDQLAPWTVNAYTNVWLNNPAIQAVLPFQLLDGNWDSFAWVDGNGNPRPVYNAVRDQRCAAGIGGPC